MSIIKLAQEYKEHEARRCREVLDVLSSHFKITPPAFRFNRTYRGLYYTGRRLVTVPHPLRNIGPRSTEHRLLHEFAHHLVTLRGYPGEHHGPHFKAAMWQVAAAWYGDPSKYPWETEYPMVRAFAQRRLIEVAADNQ